MSAVTAIAIAASPSSSVPPLTTTPKLLSDLSPFIKIYDDGTTERLVDCPYVPPTPTDPTTGVSSKDNAAAYPPARLFMPPLADPTEKLPILVYFHAGGFIVGSAFSSVDLRYMNALTSETKAIVVYVEYPLVPEQRLPAAYEESWAALKWVCSHVLDQTQFEKDTWITEHGDLGRIFVGGDSAGANIAHNIVMRAGSDPLPGNLKLTGLIVTHPYFWGSTSIGNDFDGDVEQSLGYRVWKYAFPGAPGGIDCPMINPIADGAPRLSGLGCSKLLVSLAEKDILTGRGFAYAEEVRKSGWKGTVEVVEVGGEDHCFHIFQPEVDKSRKLFGKLGAFIHA